MPGESNIIIFKVKKPDTAVSVNMKLQDQGILAGVAGTDLLRMVTHLDITKSMAEVVCSKLINMNF
jgi:threonine aldolase